MLGVDAPGIWTCITDSQNGNATGERNGSSVLLASDIPVIRRRLAEGEAVKAIARGYGVAPSTIRKIRDGKTWRDV
jgi:DNA-binding NarL/FixJ family response regulator